MLASIVLLVAFVHHACQGLRVAGLIDLVGDRSREFIVREHGAHRHAGREWPWACRR